VGRIYSKADNDRGRNTPPELGLGTSIRYASGRAASNRNIIRSVEVVRELALLKS